MQGKNESLRARAILRSLVPLEDLLGVLSLRFTLQNPAAGEERPKSDMPSGLIPGHKQSVVLFLERVYGIEQQDLFFKILEEAFLPDLRAATMLDRVGQMHFTCFSIIFIILLSYFSLYKVTKVSPKAQTISTTYEGARNKNKTSAL